MMKKNITLLIVLLFATIYSHAQALIKLTIFDDYKVGYGVTMFYYIANVDSLISGIKRIDTFTEHNILKNAGQPIIGKYDIVDGCVCCSSYNLNCIRLFKSGGYAFSIKKGTLKLGITVLPIKNPKICVVKLLRKIWLSYDVIFQQGVFINAPVKIRKMTSDERKKLVSM